MSKNTNKIPFGDALECFREVGRMHGTKVLMIADESGLPSPYEWFAVFRTDDWKDGGVSGLVDRGHVDFEGPLDPGAMVFHAHKKLLHGMASYAGALCLEGSNQ